MSDEALIYMRVSTKGQAERGGEVEGSSIPAQREACSRKAEQLKATVAAEFIDAGTSRPNIATSSLQEAAT
jgi:DNA invertase Pin-like site-specific DNA recombinase